MWITLERDADLGAVRAQLQGLGLWTQVLNGRAGVALHVATCSQTVDPAVVLAIAGVADVLTAPSEHPLVDALSGRSVEVAGLAVGGGEPAVLMAGPCSVESEEQIERAAAQAAAAGARILRGGAFKPRSSPYSFAGCGSEALAWLRAAADRHGLAVVTEVLSEHDVSEVAQVADLIQIGSRNMQNFALLRQVGGLGKPVLLKRGMAATLSEWLLAGEHALAGGATGVIYCERGIQGFDPNTRNLLDLGAVAMLHHSYRLPVIVDPSHAVGRRDLIPALARAALACGADGLLLETHPDPAHALSDGAQALDGQALSQLGEELFYG
jgi:3-deoxy-7-phosphoheptulonate synthase